MDQKKDELKYWYLGQFEAEFEEQVREIMKSTHRQAGGKNLHDSPFAPHITLMSLPFPAPPELREKIGRALVGLLPISVTFKSISIFLSNQNVIYLQPDHLPDLIAIRKAVREILQVGGDEIDDIYHDETWMPHLTIAYEIPAKKVGKAMSFLKNRLRPISGKLTTIRYAEYPPYRHIEDIVPLP